MKLEHKHSLEQKITWKYRRELPFSLPPGMSETDYLTQKYLKYLNGIAHFLNLDISHRYSEKKGAIVKTEGVIDLPNRSEFTITSLGGLQEAEVKFPNQETYFQHKELLLELASVPGFRGHKHGNYEGGYQMVKDSRLDQHILKIPYHVDTDSALICGLLKMKNYFSNKYFPDR